MNTPTNPDAPEAKPPHYVIKRKIEPMYAEHFKARAKEEAAMDATPTGTDTPDDAEAKRRAQWLHDHRAPHDWVVLTASEVATIKRELTEANADRNALRGKVEELKRDNQERREQSAAAVRSYLDEVANSATLKAQLDAAKKAGEDDKARLDWLDSKGVWSAITDSKLWQFVFPGNPGTEGNMRVGIRCALDAARSASPEDQP